MDRLRKLRRIMIKIANRYILGLADKAKIDADYIDVRYSPKFREEGENGHAPEYYHICLKHSSGDATIKADGNTYATEAEANTALDNFVASIFDG